MLFLDANFFEHPELSVQRSELKWRNTCLLFEQF